MGAETDQIAPTKRPRGRPRKLTGTRRDQVLDHLAVGGSVTTVAACHWSTLYRACDADADFCEEVQRAREVGIDHIIGRVVGVADRILAGDIRPDAGRAAATALIKAAALRQARERREPDSAPPDFDLSALSDQQLDQLEAILRVAAPDEARRLDR